VPCHNFIRAAAPHLVPILLEQLTKQEEGQEQDHTAWNLSVASGMCLGLVAQVVGNAVVPLVSLCVWVGGGVRRAGHGKAWYYEPRKLGGLNTAAGGGPTAGVWQQTTAGLLGSIPLITPA
jgi:hypothetical protein